MTFWVLGKARNLAAHINLKEVSSKLISYGASNDKVEQDIEVEQVDSLVPSEEELMEKQLRAYKTLTELQERLVREHNQRERRRLLAENGRLEEELEQLRKKEQTARRQQEKHDLHRCIQRGDRNITEIIQANILLKERIIGMRHEYSSK